MPSDIHSELESRVGEDIVELWEHFGDLKEAGVIWDLHFDSLEYFLQNGSSLSVCREISSIKSLKDSVLCSFDELHNALVAPKASHFDKK